MNEWIDLQVHMKNLARQAIYLLFGVLPALLCCAILSMGSVYLTLLAIPGTMGLIGATLVRLPMTEGKAHRVITWLIIMGFAWLFAGPPVVSFHFLLCSIQPTAHVLAAEGVADQNGG